MKNFFLLLGNFLIPIFIFAQEKVELAGPVAIKNFTSENEVLIRIDWSGSKVIQDFLKKNKINSKKFECREWKEDRSDSSMGSEQFQSCLLRWGKLGFEDLGLEEGDVIDRNAGFESNGSAAVFDEEGELKIRLRGGVAKKILEIMEPNYIKIHEMSFQSPEMFCAKRFTRKLYPFVECKFVFHSDGTFEANSQKRSPEKK